MEIRQHPSPNFGERRGGASVDLVVLHYTAMANVEEALERLCDPEYEVSSHYLIAAQGAVIQMVQEDQRAWHAGIGSWGNCCDVNSNSIGIELANDGNTPFGARQLNSLEGLLSDIFARHSIRPQQVIGHSDIAFLRKSDPGRRFDWRRLALAGLSVWPNCTEPYAVDGKEFLSEMAIFGYRETDDLAALLNAFRQRFRPWAEGPLEVADMSLIKNLARRYPVDLIFPTP